MTIVLFDTNHITSDEVWSHRELIHRILCGESKYPQMKQLAGLTYHGGEKIYRAKIDKSKRLYFTYTKTEENKRALVILSSNNHDYNKLRRQLNAYQKEQHEELIFEPIEEALPVLNQQEEMPLSLRPSLPYKGRVLILDDKQQEILNFNYNGALIILGPPGSGKTSLTFNILLRQLKDRDAAEDINSNEKTSKLFLSSSPLVVDMHKAMYEKEHQEQSSELVLFHTWNSLLALCYPTPYVFVEEQCFSEWLKEMGINENSHMVHYELSLIKALGFDAYTELGQRECHYSRNDELHGEENAQKQKQFFFLLNKWEDYLQRNQWVDPMVATLTSQFASPYSAIYLDETQNMPPVALKSLIPLAKDYNFFAALDSDQCLLSSPYIHHCLKKIQFLHYGQNVTEHYLTTDWRSRQEITQVGNHLLDSKHRLDGGTKRRPYRNIQSAHLATGLVSWVDASCFDNLKIYGVRAGTVVIVPKLLDEVSQELIKNKVSCEHILTPEQAIGLEFETVILWDFFSGSPEIQSLARKTPGNPLTIEQWNALNALYVALKRPEKHLFICDRELLRWNDLAITLLGDIKKNQFDIQKLKPINEEEEQNKRQEQVSHHLQQKNYAQASTIMRAMNKDSSEIERVIEQVREESSRKKTPQPTPVLTHSASNKKKSSRSKSSKKNSRTEVLENNQSLQMLQASQKLINDILTKGAGAIKNLLISPNVDRILDTPLNNIHPTYPSSTVLHWLCLSYREPLAVILKEMLCHSKGPKPLFSILCKTVEGLSLFDVVLPLLVKTEPKILPYVCNNVGRELFLIHFNTIFHQLDDCELTETRLVNALLFLKNKKSRQASNRPICLGGSFSLVHFAAQSGYLDLLRLLKEIGFALDKRDNKGITPLLHAAYMGHVKILIFFNELNFDLNEPDDAGYSPEFLAASKGHVALLRYLYSIGACFSRPIHDGSTPAHIATQNAHVEVLTFFHEVGVNLNEPNHKGITPVFIAAQMGYLSVLEFFQKVGIPLNTRDNNGSTPGAVAAHQGHVPVLQLLNNAGIALDTPDNLGFTAVHYAAKNGHVDVLLFLKGIGLSLDNTDDNVATPAFVAAENGQLRVLELFQKLGVSLNELDSNGSSLAHIAAQNGHVCMLQFLKDIGLPLYAFNKKGKSPMDLAIQCNQELVQQFFKKEEEQKIIKLPLKDLFEPSKNNPPMFRSFTNTTFFNIETTGQKNDPDKIINTKALN